jgi:sigma-E factor negative regulatory protein RseA
MDKMNTQELISALADGQLQGEALQRGLEAAVSDPAAVDAWQTYHLIGDILRSRELARGTAPSEFIARLQENLRLEQPLAGPPVRPADVTTKAQAAHHARPAANEGQFWKLVAGLASVAAVAAIGWTVLGTGGKGAGAQLAGATGTQQPGVFLTGSPGGAMLRDPRLDQLLQAHRQLGGATALQAPAGFLRNATFEGPAR